MIDIYIYIHSKVLPTAQGVQGGNTPKCYI